MSKADVIEVEGTVIEKLKGGKFLVEIKTGETSKRIMCSLSGKMNLNNIRIINGDAVTVEMSPYDLTKGRITWRTR